MNYKVTFSDGTTETIEAPDWLIAKAWAHEDANYQDSPDHPVRVKSIKEAK
jgi:hypothetical protein